MRVRIGRFENSKSREMVNAEIGSQLRSALPLHSAALMQFALCFVRCDQLSAGLPPVRVRRCRAHIKKARSWCCGLSPDQNAVVLGLLAGRSGRSGRGSSLVGRSSRSGRSSSLISRSSRSSSLVSSRSGRSSSLVGRSGRSGRSSSLSRSGRSRLLLGGRRLLGGGVLALAASAQRQHDGTANDQRNKFAHLISSFWLKANQQNYVMNGWRIYAFFQKAQQEFSLLSFTPMPGSGAGAEPSGLKLILVAVSCAFPVRMGIASNHACRPRMP